MRIRFIAGCLLLAGACLAQDDDGPPKLKRGKPDGTKQTTNTSEASRDTEPAAPPPPQRRSGFPSANPTAAPSTPAAATRSNDSTRDETPTGVPSLRRGAATPVPPPSEDPFLDRAREAAAAFTDKLPNFLCQEIMTRYQSESRPVNWRVIDTLSMDLVYEDHKEHYKNIKINNKLTGKSLEESGGAWSTGDFGTLQAALFDEGTQGDFHSAGSDRIEGKDAIRYDVAVEQNRSGWTLDAEGNQITVGYKGTVWLERDSARVLRLEIQAVRIPGGFPFSSAEWTIDYAYTRISGEEFLLPVRSETLNCGRGTRFCSRNVIDFRNYRRYAGESSITFE